MSLRHITGNILTTKSCVFQSITQVNIYHGYSVAIKNSKLNFFNLVPFSVLFQEPPANRLVLKSKSVQKHVANFVEIKLKYKFTMVSVLQQIDSGHEDLIHGAEIDYYGLNLATCSSDNSVKVNFMFF